MILDDKILKSGEQAVFALRALYQRYGYIQFKMSKFEEYDFYVRNKDFLVGDGVITFNDTDGKLLALKPDVTLSIVKSNQDESETVHKLYYNENVYRISKNTHTFKEIMQTGLEYIGNIDTYAMTEVVLLAVKSLEAVSENYMLDLSHLGVLSALMQTLSVSESDKKKLIHCIGEKNPHGVREICAEANVPTELSEKLVVLIGAYGKPSDVLPKLRALDAGEEAEKAIKELEVITQTLETVGYANRIHIDFSVVNDMNYYSGIVFRGFIDGIPEGILSGGRYDKLMRKMGSHTGAVGFAVYLDMLELLDTHEKEYDTDILLLYDDQADTCELIKAVSVLAKNGTRVLAQKIKPEAIRYRQLLAYRNGGLEILEIGD
ncbi:MAG: ATP phosphoribosyltransferase regulatory subunit [Clostridia bacterium]|nr:ATP phosphoribosyltransferase regulatory subunit [Clostridia bacterium]